MCENFNSTGRVYVCVFTHFDNIQFTESLQDEYSD